MAKRQLYKLAPSTLVEQLQNSPSTRSLAQGILSNNGSPWYEEPNRSTNSSFEATQLNVFKTRKGLSPALQGEENLRTPEKKVLQEPLFETPDKELSNSKSKIPDFTHQLDNVSNNSQQRMSFTSKNEVVVVDASGPVLNPELSEVSTTLHKIFSPAKVICHSPSPEKSPEQRMTMEENIKVKVDSPKEIIFATENTSKNDSAETDSQNSENRTSTTSQVNQDKVTKKKKKAPRIIQSRYLNPKETKPQKQTETKPKTAKSLTSSFFHDISAIDSNPKGQVKGQMSKTKKAKVTSTPFNPAAWSEKTRNYVPDGSYLDMTRNQTISKQDVDHEIAKKQKAARDKTGQATTAKAKTSGADSGIAMASQSHSEHVSELQLEMEYCRMLQAMYIRAKVEETFSKQEKEAKYQIYKVWQENQRLKTEVRNLEKAIRAKKHTMALDQLLKAQDSGLRAVEKSLDQFQNNYFIMGEALDSTRHYLPLEDIKVQDEDKLIAALKESQMLLADISSYTGTSRTDVQKLSKDLSLLVENLGSQISEQDRCQELLMAAKSLTNQERSLQSQILLFDVKRT